MYDFPGATRETPYGDFAECEPCPCCDECGCELDYYDDGELYVGDDRLCKACWLKYNPAEEDYDDAS